MASAEERREARKRKILQNSDIRMRKLLGQNEETSVNSVIENTPKDILSTLQNSENPPQSKTDTDIVNPTAVAPSSPSDNTQPSPPESVPRIVTERKGPSTVKIQNISPLIVPDAKDESGSNEKPALVHTRKNTKGNSDELLKILDLLRLGCMVLLAVVVRWVLSFGFGIFYIQSIFIPFIVTEVAIYAFQHINMQGVILPHTSSLLSGALMLCGVKQNLILVYNMVMGYVAAITEDCATYLFTFFVCNMFMGSVEEEQNRVEL